jgi:hypothetical protein
LQRVVATAAGRLQQRVVAAGHGQVQVQVQVHQVQVQVQAEGDGRERLGGILDRRQVDDVHAVGEVARHALSGDRGQRQPGLADPGWSGQRQ